LPDFKQYNSNKVDQRHPAFNNPALKLLLDDVRLNFEAEYTAS